MAKNEEKANDYRLERKKRLAKAAKTRAKGGDSTKVVSIIVYAICIVAVLALCCFGLYQFGVPQKVMPALTVGDRTYSVAEYSYYYTTVFQTYANSQNSLGMALLDTTKDPAAQTTTDKDGNTITYDEVFRNQVKENLETTDYYLKKAKVEGVTLSDESKKEIDDTIAELESYAKQYGYSASRYISVLYGKGLNLKKFRSLLEDQYLVSQYTTTLNEDVYKEISDEQIEAKFAESPGDYQLVDIRLLGKSLATDDESSETEGTDVTATDAADVTATDAAAEETTAEAELKVAEMLDKITDEASFIELAKEYCDEGDRATFESETASLVKGLKKSIVSSNIGSDLADWLFDSARVAGDKRTYTTKDYAYVLYLIKTAYRSEDRLPSARHILISFDTVKSELKSQAETEAADATATDAAALDDTTVKTVKATDGTSVSNKGTAYSAEVVLKAYEEAKKILDLYKSGDQTEEAFGALAEQHSADTGSVGEKATNGGGGLYKDIEKGQMVAPFEEWVYDESRQPGDTGIVMTNYGYHVMYFVSRADEPAWKADIRSAIGQAQIASDTDAVKAEIGDIATEKAFYNFAWKSALKNINKLYINSNTTSKATSSPNAKS